VRLFYGIFLHGLTKTDRVFQDYFEAQHELAKLRGQTTFDYFTQPCHYDGTIITKEDTWPIIVIEKDADKESDWSGIKSNKFEIRYVKDASELVDPDHHNYFVLNSSMEFCEKVKDWAWVDFVDLQYDKYIAELKSYGLPCLNGDFIVAKVGDIARKWESYYHHFKENCLFIRPITDKKFPSLNYGLRGGPQQLADMGVHHNQRAIIAKSQRIKEEYRFFIHYKTIITASMYKQNDDVIYSTDIPESARQLADKTARSDFDVNRYTLDIAITYDDVPQILEVNNWSSSGVYACDKERIALATIANWL
jgi:hypothetical protein